jgi:hypothetical protein
VDELALLVAARPVVDDDELVAARSAASQRLTKLVALAETSAPYRRQLPARLWRRRWIVVAAVVALAALVAAPALGLHGQFVHFFESEPAPSPVRLEFARMDVGAPPGMETNVIAGETRRVMSARIDGKQHVLYVAPTPKGGFCLEWTDASGGCWADRAEYERKGLLIGGEWSVDEHGPVEFVPHVSGEVIAPGTDRVQVEYEDGTADDVDLVWVSKPVDAGFFFFSIPREHRVAGRRAIGLVALNEDGDAIAREHFHYPHLRERLLPNPQTGLPNTVQAAQKRLLISLTSERGRTVGLWTAPSAEGGTCHWITLDGRPARYLSCPPRRALVPLRPLGLALLPGSPPILIFGAVPPEVATVELQYEDGEQTKLHPVEAWVLAEIPSAHYPRGHRLRLARALAADGTELGSQKFSTTETGLYPCDTPVDIGAGVKSCP